LIAWLLKELEKNPTSLFRKADLLKKSKARFEKLKQKGFLTYYQTSDSHETYPCNLPCPNACPMEVVPMEGKLFAICPRDSEISPIPLDRNELDKYAFCIEKFLEQVRMANKLGGVLHRIDKDYLYFGYMTYKGHRVDFIFGFTITRKSVLELTGLKRFCADDDFLVVFSPVSVIEDVSLKRELDRERVVQTSFTSSLNFQTYQLFLEKLLSGAIAREGAETEQKPQAKTQEWSEVSLDIIDDETVRYKIGKDNWQRANYAELGFKNKLKGLPNKLWGIFKTLAENCKDQVIEFRTAKNISKDIDRICGTLKAFFGPQDRPIRYNKKNKIWNIAFRLTFKSQDSKDS